MKNDNESHVELDLSYLQETAGGDTSFILELLDTYEEQIPLQIDQLKQAWESQESDKLGNAAHAIKGNFKIFGLKAYADLAYELEQVGRNADEAWKAKAKVLVPDLIVACESVKEKIALQKKSL